MSISILGGSGYQRGVEVVETGINCEGIEVEYAPEVNDNLQGIGGETFVTAKSAVPMRNISANGEVNAGTGWGAFTFIAAPTIANDVADFGSPTGTILMDGVTVTQNRTAWRSAAFRLASYPNRTVS